jgi:outer membrane protease
MRRMRAVRALSLPALFLAGLLTGPSAFGQGATLTVRTGTGIMYGTSRELVLDGSFAVSELDWAIQPVFYVESVLELRALGGLAVSLSVRNGIPAQSGFITDSDWLNYPMNTDKTNFSQHDCYTERAVLVDARAGWEFSLGDVLAIQPFGAFEFMSYKWTARDGYLQYPPGWFSASPPPPPYPAWSPTWEKIPVYGTGIVYQQTFLIPAAGLRATVRFLPRWEAALSFTASPVAFCFDLDNHVFRGADFYENMANGLLLEPGLSVRLRLSPRAAFSLDASYRSISGLVGDTTEVVTGVNYPGFPSSPTNPTPGTTYTFRDSGGAAYQVWSASLFFDLSL